MRRKKGESERQYIARLKKEIAVLEPLVKKYWREHHRFMRWMEKNDPELLKLWGSLQ